VIDAAIVGLGRWGRALVEGAAGTGGALRFTRAVSRDPAPHRDFAARHGLAFAENLAAALADPAIGAVVLATPHSQHAGQIAAAAAAGKAIYCEKPLTLTRAEAADAIEACRRAGVVLAVGHDKRWFPPMQELFRLVRAGELGEILHLEGHFSNEVAGAQFSQWRHSDDESPAGGMTGTAIHVLDAMIGLVGPVRRVAAFVHARKLPPDPTDTLSILLDFASGTSGTLAAVRSTPLFLRLHAFGRNASAEAVGRSELVLRRTGAAPQHLRFPAVDTVAANLAAFAAAVAGRAPFPIATEEMLATVAAFEAVSAAVKADGPMRAV
jgi:predicted dehydrogenase